MSRNSPAYFADALSLAGKKPDSVWRIWQKTPLEPFEEHVRQRFDEWLEEKRSAGITFNSDQLAWLKKMRDYISASGSVDREHLEADNVLGPIYKVFGEKLWPLMEELNLTLVA